MARTRLYSLIMIACVAGYAWIAYQHNRDQSGHEPAICMIKSTTGIPCPSCGSSRSVLMIMEGNYIGALKMNPLGFVISLIMVVCPFWILADVAMRRNSFLHFYHAAESFVRIKWVSITMISLIVVNWIWNIIKGV